MLYIFAGLPGVGKSALSICLARKLGAVHLRIDTIEQALRDCGVWVDGPEGYEVGYGVAQDNLRLGLDVVADSVNPLRVTRGAWRGVAMTVGAPFVEIEVVCSDEQEHRRRVETRSTDIQGLAPPSWEDVLSRDYDSWDQERIVIDTASRTPEESMATLHRALRLGGQADV